MIRRSLVVLYVLVVIGIFGWARYYWTEVPETMRVTRYSEETQGDFSSAVSLATDHKEAAFFRECLVTYMNRRAFQIDVKQPDALDRVWVDAETSEILQVEPLRFEDVALNVFRPSLADATLQSGDVADKLGKLELQAQAVISEVQPFMDGRRMQYKVVMVSKTQNILEFTYDPRTGARSIGGYSPVGG